jgi:hypothetical protein
MFKTDFPLDDKKTIKVKDMKPCQIGVIVNDTGWEETLVMRGQSTLVNELLNLSEPKGGMGWSWQTPGEPPDFTIKLLPTGTKITLTIGEDNV